MNQRKDWNPVLSDSRAHTPFSVSVLSTRVFYNDRNVEQHSSHPCGYRALEMGPVQQRN